MVEKVKLAALNNAVWCDGVCRAHGLETEFTDRLWICRGTPPRFHSPATTLLPGSSEAVRRLAPNGFKDGFFDIDADPLDYRELFRAHWIWLQPPPLGSTSLTWRRVQTDEEMQNWERGWAAGDEEASNFPRQFPYSLLGNPQNAFMAGFDGENLVAGCILNFTEPVVGISNTFQIGWNAAELWSDFAQLPSIVFPGFSAVGYERGEDLAAAIGAGFEAVAELRVWVSR